MPQLVPDLLTLREAQALVLGRARPLSGETVPVWEAAGRVTSEPARAVVALPPFPSSAMDGFAVRAADLPGTLPVVERIAAGRPAPRGQTSSCCRRWPRTSRRIGRRSSGA